MKKINNPRIDYSFVGIKGQELEYKRFLKRVLKSFSRYMNEPTKACLNNKNVTPASIFTDEMLEYFYNKINFSILNSIANFSLNSSNKIVEKLAKEQNDFSFVLKNLDAQAAATQKSFQFIGEQKEKVLNILDNALEKRKTDLDEFRSSFLFDTKDKEEKFRHKYPEPKYAFTASMSRTDINNLNRDLAAIKATKLGIKRFTWSTSNDERVRESHKALDTKEFEYSNMPKEYNDYNCRCVQIPIIEFKDLDD